MPRLSLARPRRHIRHDRHHRHWGRELAEAAALFTAMAAADFVADVVDDGPDGRVLLLTSGCALLAAAAFHIWWARGRRVRELHGDTKVLAEPTNPASSIAPGPSAPYVPATQATPSAPPESGGGRPDAGAESEADAEADVEAGEAAGTALWRLRTRVADTPGSLGRVCTALAGSGVDVVTLQTHPLADATVDEFLLRAPGALSAAALARTVGDAGGRDTWLERADAHDLVDPPTRMLALAARTARNPAELPLALRQLFGRCSIRYAPHGSGRDERERAAGGDAFGGTVMRLREPAGGALTLRRDHLPFTPTEFARARALVALGARLGTGVPAPARRTSAALPDGFTVRPAGPDDRAAALALHARCTPETLARRYHGPVGDADRYLGHLLGPRFGRSLAVDAPTGRMVALGHLLWDDDESEVALLVEDAWQRRGIGTALLRGLLELAAEAGRDSVYAVTRATNTPVIAAMRSLGLPLDYQVEDATVVLTVELPTRAALPWTASRRR